ncbi:hypothetical protein B0T18DRAFT_328731 [Schizothecium vesticola]|uniref:BHLH domain-containing protein n=1 Tax=Schizothecium vesticola TaxID=314040 RepID=A0AA40EPI9_9PEZI|nr:hypothetical protein B0T18DRAFT_328731 [Schizothecium vesticola]
MDPDPLRHLEFFSVPNNQTINPVDQSFGLGGPPTTQPPTTLWDTAMGMGSAPSGPSSAVSFDPMAQSSPSRTIPLRPPRSRDGHERKRSRIADTTTPFDSVDYWIQFDNDESLADVSERSDLLRHDTKRTSMAQGSTISAPPTTRTAHRSRPGDLDNNSAEDNALSDDDVADPSAINLSEYLSKIDSAPPADVPPREGLYSTPLSWERPQPGLRMDSLIGLNQAALNEAEQRRLIAIAMNSGPSLGGLGANVNLNFGGFNTGFSGVFGQGLGFGGNGLNLDPISPPKSHAAQYRPMPPKRQGSVSDKGKEKEKEKEKPKTGERTAHNDIERKYRTNLKDRISELRDAVPALHTIVEDGEDDDSTNRGAKVSKGAVLTKATEYIHYLERRNKQIMQEHRKLSQRLQAFEQLLASTARPSYQMPSYSRTLFDPRGFC